MLLGLNIQSCKAASACIFKVEILSIKLGYKLIVHVKKFWHQLRGFENMFIIGGRKVVTEGDEIRELHGMKINVLNWENSGE